MDTYHTECGRILVGPQTSLFQHALDVIIQKLEAYPTSYIRIGLSGGRTPQGWFGWMSQNAQAIQALKDRVYWLCSDERCVPLSSEQSNFGNATRLLLDPLKVPQAHRLPWPTGLAPQAALEAFQTLWNERFGPTQGMHVCFTGLGADSHTLSLNPGCTLLERPDAPAFAYTRWPNGSDRLTLTPNGVARCEHILVMATGADKADALWNIHRGPYDPMLYPAQIYKSVSARVTWLCDEAAAARL